LLFNLFACGAFGQYKSQYIVNRSRHVAEQNGALPGPSRHHPEMTPKITKGLLAPPLHIKQGKQN
jgi:hypothetical protein